MKSPFIIASVLVASVFVLTGCGSMTNPSTDSSTSQTLTGSAYRDYDPSAITSDLLQGKRVVLFFHAARCPTCRSLDQNLISQIAQIPSDVVIYKTDYDTQTALKQQYEVTAQHTLVYIDNNQQKIGSTRGSATLQDIISRLNTQTPSASDMAESETTTGASTGASANVQLPSDATSTNTTINLDTTTPTNNLPTPNPSTSNDTGSDLSEEELDKEVEALLQGLLKDVE